MFGDLLDYIKNTINLFIVDEDIPVSFKGFDVKHSLSLTTIK